MNDFDLALLIIGDLELSRRKAIMAIAELQQRLAKNESEDLVETNTAETEQ